MPSPFPGMDPYLENPEIFPDLHDSLITYIRENLQANLPPPYYAAIGRRVWIEASRRSIEPDVHVLRARSCKTGSIPDLRGHGGSQSQRGKTCHRQSLAR